MNAFKILIVEDNEADRVFLEHQINRLDSDVQTHAAINGKEALTSIANNDYDLIFLDYMLPDMDGLDVLKAVYDHENDLAPCPVIMLTGQSRKDIMLEAIRYGAQDYITKDDISMDVLNVTILKAKHGYNLRLKHYEARQQLAEALRIEALGKLTGGIAHDFNSLLTIIIGNAKLCELALSDKPTDLQNLNDGIKSIKNAAQRGSSLVKQLMIFARNEYLEPQQINPNTAIMDVQDLLEQSVDDEHHIEFSLQNDVYDINVDPTQFEAMLFNLVTNARDTMPEGGTVTITTANIDNDVVMTISDTGSGIDKTTLERIFEPFFTTKQFGKGTGLGLSMVHGFVKSSGGKITIDTKVDKGSRFNISLPKSIS